MDADKRESRTGLAIVAGLGLFVLLPVLYVLSIGPIVWLTVRGGMPDWVITNFFYPLVLLGKWSPAFRDFLQWYMDWWAG